MTSPTPEPTTLAAFSVDVEDYFQVESLRAHCPRDQWNSQEDRVVVNTERLIGLLDRRHIKGTFFFLGCVAEKHPELVRRVASQGHEVACHGFNHELVYNLTKEEFREDIRRSKQLLQDLSGQDVVGYRAPSYTIMERTLWAIPILVDEGFLYDSSIFPIPRRRYGMPRANRWPHRIEMSGTQMAEFPLPTVKLGRFNLPATGGAYLRLLPMRMQRGALQRMLQKAQPFVLNVHPWEFDPDQPRFPVDFRTKWTHYHNLGRAQRRLESLLDLAAFRTQREVLRDLDLI